MSESIREHQKDLQNKVFKYFTEPWTIYRAPFRMVGNVYHVGTEWVSCYLVDTAEGLVLIDCTMQETLYQVIHNIFRLGFDPKNIKKLFLTHAHLDHCGAAKALKELTGCEIWLGRDDAFFVTERRDLMGGNVAPFEIDRYYEYGKTIEFGGVSFTPIHAPGHTPGMTCIFFDVVHEGRPVTCAVDGGFGTNGMSKLELREAGLPEKLQQDFIDSLTALKALHVDVVLPSHAAHALGHPIFEIAMSDDGSGNGFVEETAWGRMLDGKLAMLLAIREK